MAKQTGKAVRMYSINQEKLDEAIQTWMDFILEVASTEKLLDIRRDVEARIASLPSKASGSPKKD